MLKIKEVAGIAGVSIRTLHHYDQIGLLKPEKVAETGYRLYNENDLDRLQQILFFKEMDVPLQVIKRILDDPFFDQLHALKLHKDLLLKKRDRLERMIDSIDSSMDTLKGGREMTDQERFEPFDMTEIEEHQKKYEAEVKEKYGHTEAYKESQQKTKNYKSADWEQIQQEGNRIYEEMAKRMGNGPKNRKVQELVASYQQHITDNFYECSTEIYSGLADMYVADARFTKNIEKFGEGFAVFLHDAIKFYCRK